MWWFVCDSIQLYTDYYRVQGTITFTSTLLLYVRHSFMRNGGKYPGVYWDHYGDNFCHMFATRVIVGGQLVPFFICHVMYYVAKYAY